MRKQREPRIVSPPLTRADEYHVASYACPHALIDVVQPFIGHVYVKWHHPAKPDQVRSERVYMNAWMDAAERVARVMRVVERIAEVS